MLTSLDSLILEKICSFLTSATDAKNFRLSCKHVAARVFIQKIEYGFISEKYPVLHKNTNLVYRKSTCENNIVPEKQVTAWSTGLDRKVLKLVWTTSLKLDTSFRVNKCDVQKILGFSRDSNSNYPNYPHIFQINVRWMMRDISNLVANYRSQIKFSTELIFKNRVIASCSTTTQCISRKEKWCYARLRPCKGVLSVSDLDDISSFSVVFKADEDNRWKGNLAWYFTELIISPYSTEPPELTCDPIPDNSSLLKINEHPPTSPKISLMSCAQHFALFNNKPQTDGRSNEFQLSTNYPWLFLNRFIYDEHFYENTMQKLAGYLLPIVLALFTSLIFGSEALDRFLTFENVVKVVGGLLVGILVIRVV